jgi:sigma-B regulation protein RsbU (phosphoserine phosphatase)
MSLRVKFTLWTFLSLALVMAAGGYLLGQRASVIEADELERAIGRGVELTLAEGRPQNFRQEGDSATIVPGTQVRRFPVRYGLERGEERPAELFQGRGGPDDALLQFLVPADGGAGRGLNDLILVVTVLVIGVGAVVSFLIANSVAAPIESLVDDVRQIARGNLHHRTHVRVGGEVASLAREIDKMAAGLREAQEAELEHSAREREIEVADEVRESLLPSGTPQVAGYDLFALQVGCSSPGGDFYDVLPYPDGSIGLLVCEVNGPGIPGALIGATTRAYASALLPRISDVREGFCELNRHLARGIRPGLYVSALYALLDPATGEVEVACAGHKVPLLHHVASEGRLVRYQPEGFALGFDKGSVFDQRLETVRLTLAPGDRLVLSNTGPIQVVDPSGEEWGEERFYRLALRRAGERSEDLMGRLEGALDAFADEAEYPHDISVITIRRDP